MKISDDELLQLVWLNQLRQLAKGVVQGYLGDQFGLKGDNEYWYRQAGGTRRKSRARVTTVLSEGQLWVRFLKLASTGRLWVCPRYGDFMLDTQTAREAYEAARQFWVMEGVMDRPHQPRSMESEKFARLAAECEQLLLAKFSGCYSDAPEVAA